MDVSWPFGRTCRFNSVLQPASGEVESTGARQRAPLRRDAHFTPQRRFQSVTRRPVTLRTSPLARCLASPRRLRQTSPHHPRPLGGMADAGDLKSSARKGIPVRPREGPPQRRCWIGDRARGRRPRRPETRDPTWDPTWDHALDFSRRIQCVRRGDLSDADLELGADYGASGLMPCRGHQPARPSCSPYASISRSSGMASCSGAKAPNSASACVLAALLYR